MLYQLWPPPAPAKRLVGIIVAQAEILATAVPLLIDGQQRDALARHEVELHHLEHEADDELNQALAELYTGITEIPAFVRAKRWSELYEMVEATTNGAEQIAQTLAGIMEQRL